MKLKATFRDGGRARIPRGYRELNKGERIRPTDRFLKYNKGPWTTLSSEGYYGGQEYSPHTKSQMYGEHTHIRRIVKKPKAP